MNDAVRRRRLAVGLLAGAFLAIAGFTVYSESADYAVSLPAPSGVFRRLITTTETFLARDGGHVFVGSKGVPKVDRSSMTVQGAVSAWWLALGDTTESDRGNAKLFGSPATPGQLVYDLTKDQLYYSSRQDGWKRIGSSSAKVIANAMVSRGWLKGNNKNKWVMLKPISSPDGVGTVDGARLRADPQPTSGLGTISFDAEYCQNGGATEDIKFRLLWKRTGEPFKVGAWQENLEMVGTCAVISLEATILIRSMVGYELGILTSNVPSNGEINPTTTPSLRMSRVLDF